jgi:hypothetical protein
MCLHFADKDAPQLYDRQADEMMYLVKNTSRDKYWDRAATGDEVTEYSRRDAGATSD